MQNRPSTPTRRTIVFRHWSRKSYAIFAGLGRHIVIGVLAVGICYAAMQKSNVISECEAKAKPLVQAFDSDDNQEDTNSQAAEILSVLTTTTEEKNTANVVVFKFKFFHSACPLPLVADKLFYFAKA